MSIDPVTLQVLVGGLRGACDEMNSTLIRAAHSANIKERRDCSTALFDATGEMVMQAEAIPVHLGSMPEAVAAVIDRDHPDGRYWVLNDPFMGGTHLPDITVVSAIHREGSVLGFAASRAHHADVGGPTPAGMPAHSTSLEDEGEVISPTLVSAGEIAGLVGGMRNPDQRIADLRAQLAANQLGARRLGELADRHGDELLRRGMREVLDYAERRTRAAIAEMPDGSWESTDVLEHDGGAEPHDIALRVRATIDGDTVRLDFSGTDGQVRGNLNCPAAVTRSAALFAVRVLADPDAPPSAGAHRPVEIEIPQGSVLRADPGAAVAAGNVETSSRVADLVLDALAGAVPAPAQGQGTMNNLTLAGDRFTYYETLGGGQGACPTGPGPSAVHVAMSNTLNTPVEAFEAEFPLRVRRLALRRESGGAGAQPGGDGLIRELEALEPMRYTLLTERRRHAPRGRDGGSDGARGRNLLNGRELGSKASGELGPGDVLRVETPGGGGWGAARNRK
ncbi:MAG: hydantoinase B/oxoprolinase family protein [Solirubrobacterales bacterium]